MKNFMTLCAFALIVLCNVQSSFAQDQKIIPEVVAKQQLNDLNTELKLDGDQQRTLWKSLIVKATAYNELNANKQNLTEEELQKSKQNIESVFLKDMKSTLSESQFKIYSAQEVKE